MSRVYAAGGGSSGTLRCSKEGAGKADGGSLLCPVLNGAMFFNRLSLEFLAIEYREEYH